MLRSILLITFTTISFLALAPKATAQQDADTTRHFRIEEGDTSFMMKRYVFVFLLRGYQAEDYSKEELAEIQDGHMKNMDKMAEQGKLLVAGPFGDDGEKRGILIMDCATLEEAEELVNNDPAIKAGRLRAEMHFWWGAVGTTLK